VNIRKSILLRARIAFLLFFLFGVAVIVRIGKIQFQEGEKWAEKSRKITLQYRQINATRGNIYSDNGSLLATSLPEYRLCIDPTVSSNDVFRSGIDSLSFLLSRYFRDNSKDGYKRRINDARLSGKKYIVVNKKLIRHQDKKMMMSWPIFREGRMGGGVIFEKIDKRFRPFKFLALRTIGFLNEDNYGAGLEYSFNDVLAGKNGKALFQRMVGGNWKPVNDGTEIRPEDGLDIVTTLDVNIQDVAESSLLKALREHNADYGCVVVMSVKTGEIKAISNLTKNGTNYAEILNYAVSGQGLTEPGSTFKLVSMMALLENTNIKLTDSIETGNGRHRFFDRVMVDHKHGGYGTITIQEAFEKSSNVAISKLVSEHFGIQPQKFIDFIKKTGMSQPLGLQMKGEGIPYIKSPSDRSWSGITLPWMSIGYELQLTPLQTLTLYNAVANDGKMVLPMIVKQIKSADQVKKEFAPVVLNERICSNKTLKQLRSLLEGVVEHGTASNIKNSHYKIAGKTGTAQKIKEGGGYSRNYYTSFAGYFPADNPKYSCIVIIDNPKNNYQYGSDVAAPVFKTIADKIFSVDMELHKPSLVADLTEDKKFPVIQAGYQDDLNIICDILKIKNNSAVNEDWVRAKVENNAVNFLPQQLDQELVPDVRGMRLRDALYLLENSGYMVEVRGTGRVRRQSQAPGSKLIKGSRISIELERWPS
jgi:cell division protein FtsI (penicillin-binding protein 3)